MFLFGPQREKTCPRGGVANNKGADQAAHWRRLISALLFAFRELATGEILSF